MPLEARTRDEKGERPSVLVVDRGDRGVRLVRRALDDHPAREEVDLVSAACARDAERVLASRTPSLVLVVTEGAWADAVEVIAAARARSIGAIVAVTDGVGRADGAAEALRAGADALLREPVSPSFLASILASALRSDARRNGAADTLRELVREFAHAACQPLNAIRICADALLSELRAEGALDPARLWSGLSLVSEQVVRLATMLDEARRTVKARPAGPGERGDPSRALEVASGAVRERTARVELNLEPTGKLPLVSLGQADLELAFDALIGCAVQLLAGKDEGGARGLVVRAWRTERDLLVRVMPASPDAPARLLGEGGLKGLGLGLAIARALAEVAGGTASVVAGDGRPPRLTLSLPLCSEDAT